MIEENQKTYQGPRGTIKGRRTIDFLKREAALLVG